MLRNSPEIHATPATSYCCGRLKASQECPLQFAVGLKLKSKSEHVIVDAEDALIAALKVKAERREAQIMYVRRQNRRGDTRNPPGRRGS